MCQGVREPYAELCDLFNTATQNGAKMDRHSELLRRAVDEIVYIFRKRSSSKLTTDRSALLIPKGKQVTRMDSFELVTWLVIL